VLSLVQTPLHAVWLAEQQTLDEHDVPELQTCPQPPQLLLLVLVLTHAPPQQLVPAPHTCPQLPQLLLSVCSLTQVPLQSDLPEEQLHVLPEHVPLEHGYAQSPPHTVVQTPVHLICGLVHVVWIVSRS